MSLEIRCEQLDGYFLVQAQGEFTLDGGKRAVEQGIRTAIRSGSTRILYDIRKVRGLDLDQASVTSRFTIGVHASQMLPQGVWMAVLVSKEQFDDYKFVETVVRNRGRRMKTTPDEDAAIAWLVRPPS